MVAPQGASRPIFVLAGGIRSGRIRLGARGVGPRLVVSVGEAEARQRRGRQSEVVERVGPEAALGGGMGWGEVGLVGWWGGG